MKITLDSVIRHAGGEKLLKRMDPESRQEALNLSREALGESMYNFEERDLHEKMASWLKSL